jgi:hypothetical protein
VSSGMGESAGRRTAVFSAGDKNDRGGRGAKQSSD